MHLTHSEIMTSDENLRDFNDSVTRVGSTNTQTDKQTKTETETRTERERERETERRGNDRSDLHNDVATHVRIAKTRFVCWSVGRLRLSNHKSSTPWCVVDRSTLWPSHVYKLCYYVVRSRKSMQTRMRTKSFPETLSIAE